MDLDGYEVLKRDDASDTIELDRDLVIRVRCGACQASREVMRATAQVGSREAVCRECGEPATPDFEHRVVPGSDLAARPLKELGVPPFDILRVGFGDAQRHVLLAADRQRALDPPEPGGGV